MNAFNLYEWATIGWIIMSVITFYIFLQRLKHPNYYNLESMSTSLWFTVGVLSVVWPVGLILVTVDALVPEDRDW